MPYIAKFYPEAWVNDVAVDVDVDMAEPREWDVTDVVLGNPTYWTEMAEQEVSNGDQNQSVAWRMGVLDHDDTLKTDPKAPAWVREWSGPFSIRVYARRKED